MRREEGMAGQILFSKPIWLTKCAWVRRVRENERKNNV
jgi:hypothetical protein